MKEKHYKDPRHHFKHWDQEWLRTSGQHNCTAGNPTDRFSETQRIEFEKQIHQEPLTHRPLISHWWERHSHTKHLSLQSKRKYPHTSIQRIEFIVWTNFVNLGKIIEWRMLMNLRNFYYFNVDNNLKLGANKAWPRISSSWPATMIKTWN